MKAKKTTIQPTEHVHGIARRLSVMSGMSISGIYSLGALTLAARHARALEYGAKRRDLLREIREAFEAIMQEIEKEAP